MLRSTSAHLLNSLLQARRYLRGRHILHAQRVENRLERFRIDSFACRQSLREAFGDERPNHGRGNDQGGLQMGLPLISTEFR